ncbi:hypothetical protein Clacol_005980 [Clathrus columnatus]|uniref:Uncharacterized protein n=1 Tax=Clathrus columnatus TaxID=1419009 RepID=A0AAV5ADP2_9AGAM|nr:hypothetical protein Clacol_005980 [Clathrus columnatus]
MTYDELTMAWEDFNRSEELKALYFTQSECREVIHSQESNILELEYGTVPIASSAETDHTINSTTSSLPPIRAFPSGLPINPLEAIPNPRLDNNTQFLVSRTNYAPSPSM